MGERGCDIDVLLKCGEAGLDLLGGDGAEAQPEAERPHAQLHTRQILQHPVGKGRWAVQRSRLIVHTRLLPTPRLPPPMMDSVSLGETASGREAIVIRSIIPAVVWSVRGSLGIHMLNDALPRLDHN